METNALSFKMEKLFPTKSSFIIFIAYICLFVNQGILVKSSQSIDNQEYDYNITIVIIDKPIILLIMFNNAIAGIVTAYFLKNLNSILKTFASTIEILLSAILCSFIFQTKIYYNTILSIILVFIAIYIYSIKPVQQTGKHNSDDHNLNDVKILIKD